jgi:hypothetical protein
MTKNAVRKDGQDTTRASVSLASADYEQIARIASQKKVSIAWVIREAVEVYLESKAPLLSTKNARSWSEENP